MFGIAAMSLSLLVVLAGLFLLAKSKKDNLGNLYHFSSYAAIIGGLMLFFGSIVGGICMMRHCQQGSGACYSQGHDGGGCKMKSCAGMSCGMHGKSACSHQGGMSQCGAHGGAMKSCGMKGAKHDHHMMLGDDSNVKIEVEIEEDDDEEKEEEKE